MKMLIMKTTGNGNLDEDAFRLGFREWRNTPSSDQLSRAQKLYGKPLQSHVLAHRSSFARTRQDQADQRDTVHRTEPADNVSNRPWHHPPLQLGVHVDVQDPRSKLWTRRGIIVGIGRHRDYNVKLPSGHMLWRNRRYLHPQIPATSIPSHDQPAPTPSELPSASCSSQPRHSNRRRQPPTRLNIANTHGQSYTNCVAWIVSVIGNPYYLEGA